MTELPSAAKPAKPSPFPWILGGCGCLIFGISIVVFGIFTFVMKATAEPETVVNEFLAAAAAGDADRAYATFAPEMAQVQSIDEFRSVLAANPQLFDVSGVNWTKRSIDNGTAVFVGTATVRSGGEIPCTFSVRQYEGGWKIIAWHLGGESE